MKTRFAVLFATVCCSTAFTAGNIEASASGSEGSAPADDAGTGSPPLQNGDLSQSLELTRQGVSYFKSARYGEAVRVFQAALAKDQRSHAYFNLALALQKTQKLKAAEATLRSGLKSYPGDARLWQLLSGLLYEEGRFDEYKVAQKHANQLAGTSQPARVDPGGAAGDSPAATASAEQVDSRETVEQIDVVKTAANSGSADPGVPVGAFATPQRGSEQDQVIEESKETTTPAHGFPGQGDEHKWIKASQLYDEATVLLNKGALDKAVHRYKQAIAMYPYDPDFFHNLGIAYKRQGDLANAETAYRDALKLNPRDWDTYFNLGTLLYREKKYKEAKQAFTTALECNPPANGQEKIQSYLADLPAD